MAHTQESQKHPLHVNRFASLASMNFESFFKNENTATKITFCCPAALMRK